MSEIQDERDKWYEQGKKVLVVIANPRKRFGDKWALQWCEHPVSHVELVVVKMMNGRSQYRCACFICGMRNSVNLPYRLLSNEERIKARLAKVNEPDNFQMCERCGATDTERHHWAPMEFFKDADKWPTSYLCKKCHATWHKVMKQAQRVSWSDTDSDTNAIQKLTM